jgi:membrane protease YdiL (CAAX protease family)
METLNKTTTANIFIKYSITTYYLLTFLISWGGLIVIMGGPDRITSKSTTTPLILAYLVTVGGPLISGVLLTGLFKGKEGYQELISRLFKWRVPLKWYAVALLIAPLTVFATLLTLSLFAPVFMPGIFGSGSNPIASMFGLPSSDKITFMLFVLMVGLFNGFIEELGWTGFATHQLKLNHNLILTGTSVGILWGLWHLPSNYIGSAAGAGTVPLPLYLLLLLFTFLPPYRILMMWVYKYTGSLFIAVLMHASLDIFWILSTPLLLTGKERVIWYALWAVVLWSMVLIIGDRNTVNPDN